MKCDFLIKKQKEVLNAVEMIIEECSKSCLECGQCGAYSNNPHNEGCVFKHSPQAYFLDEFGDGYSDITDAAKTIQAYCNAGDCTYCLFDIDDCETCLLNGCPALWEKRLQLLKSEEEDE